MLPNGLASKKEKGKLVCDSQDLCFSFHVAVIGCLGLLLNPVKPTKMLVVGLGGGSLIRFIDRHIPNVSMCICHHQSPVLHNIIL